MPKKLKASISKCEACGNAMIYSPENGGLYCNSCKTTKAIEAQSTMPKHPLGKETDKHNNEEWLKTKKTMNCPNCGAEAILCDFQTTAVCQYCSTPMVASPKQFTGLKPDAIIPFAFGKQKAEELFKQTLKGKWLAPRKFKKSIKSDAIISFYFPAFIFEADAKTTYKGTLYNDVTVRDRDGNTSTERRYFSIAGTQATRHEGVEVEASCRLSQGDLNLVRPYNFSYAKEFKEEFVYGYALENYSSSVNDSHSQARNLMNVSIQNTILSKYSYDGVSTFNMNPIYSNEKYSYCVLPMYRINYRHKKKTYSNVMNGQTGKLGGKYPKSGLKIALIVLGILAIFAIPILAFVISALNGGA